MRISLKDVVVWWSRFVFIPTSYSMAKHTWKSPHFSVFSMRQKSPMLLKQLQLVLQVLKNRNIIIFLFLHKNCKNIYVFVHVHKKNSEFFFKLFVSFIPILTTFFLDFMKYLRWKVKTISNWNDLNLIVRTILYSLYYQLLTTETFI